MKAMHTAGTALFALFVGVSGAASASGPVTVDGTDVIYASGLSGSALSSYLYSVGGSVATAPIQVALGTDSSYLTFSATGSVLLSVPYSNNNDPDGLGPLVGATSTNTGGNGISGMEAPGQG